MAAGVALTLYSVLHEANQPHVVQVTTQSDRWVDGAEGTLSAPADPLVLRIQVQLYTANLRE